MANDLDPKSIDWKRCYDDAASIVAELTNQNVSEYLEDVRRESARKARRAAFEEAAEMLLAVVADRYMNSASFFNWLRARAAEEESDER